MARSLTSLPSCPAIPFSPCCPRIPFSPAKPEIPLGPLNPAGPVAPGNPGEPFSPYNKWHQHKHSITQYCSVCGLQVTSNWPLHQPLPLRRVYQCHLSRPVMHVKWVWQLLSYIFIFDNKTSLSILLAQWIKVIVICSCTHSYYAWSKNSKNVTTRMWLKQCDHRWTGLEGHL